jgi:Holliday junction resolvasome RuvABC endonuclease subunit
VYTDKDKNASCLRRLEKLITRLDPGTLVLEAFERHALRTDRIQRLCRSLVSLAEARGIEVAVFTRDEVRSSFIEVGARTRVEIAEAVARSLEVLRHHLPPPRKRWDKEDARLALFSAAAVALTYYRLASTSILDQLR